MESRDKKVPVVLWLIWAATCFMVWMLMVIARAIGAISMDWGLVWLGILWVPYGTLAASAAIVGMIWAVAYIRGRVRDKLRARDVNARIRAHAMAYGVWDRPEALGGKALELSAWEHYKIKRKRGETDKELRCRCMIAKADAMERSEQHGE